MVKGHFFKVLVEGFTEKLSIPKALIEQTQEELLGLAILQGPSGKCWPVKLNRTSKGTYLEGGWETFVKDHSLAEGEFLVFTHVRLMHFNVQIFGKNACEREGAFPVQASHGLTRPLVKGKTQSPQGDEVMITAKDTFTFEGSHGWTSPKERKKCQSPRRDAGKIASTSKLKALGEKAKEAACHFTSQFPYFRTQIRHYSLHTNFYLLVPKGFVKKKHLPKSTTDMVLQNANGRTWMVKFCFEMPSRISVGWKLFASENNIKEGDDCVFELVQEDTFKVHIFRGGGIHILEPEKKLKIENIHANGITNALAI